MDLIGHFANWQFDWLDVPAMLLAADTILEYPVVDCGLLPKWSQSRVTLLGDAAHPMVPRGSNGAGQTILDARAVADCLVADRGNPVRALWAYDDLRRPATSDVVLANRISSPDSILCARYERTGDNPFDRLEDVISVQEISEMSEAYKCVAGFATYGDKR
jgi:2-polyprenyl-6-methoxyphenol hydroxylase-like FAD-dependent oxidoreductase